MERKNRIDELKAQSDRLKAEEEMLNAKVAQMEKELLEAEKLRMKEETERVEKELMEKEIAELKKQLEVLEEKTVEATQPSKAEAVEPVAQEEPQIVEAGPEKEFSTKTENKTVEDIPSQTDAVPEKSEKKGGKKKLWLILLLVALFLITAACCVFFLKPLFTEEKDVDETDVEETVIDEATLDSLAIVGILEEVNRMNNDIYYTYELPMSTEYRKLLTRADNITDSITRTTGAEWDDEWYDLAIPWMDPWADPDTVEYKIVKYESSGNGADKMVEVTVEYNDPQYRGYLSTVTAIFVSEAGNWVIDNVGSHKEILADFIDRNNRAQTQVCEYVDLGLPSGVLWATCNVGASNPEEFGGYYAWGETEAKHSYGWDNYKWCRGTSETLTKYCTSISLGTVDNTDELDSSDDVATVLWGSDWRMPTDEERDELIDICVWEWTTLNGVAGFRATSKTNGNSIFFPAAGYRMDISTENVGAACYYWTKSLYSNECYFSSYIYKYSNEADWMSIPRQAGMPVRPVWKYKKITDVIRILEEPDEELVPVLDENGFISDSDEELVAVEEHDDKYIHDVVEEQPEFPGGMNALMTYLSENIQYPRVSRDNNSQGKTFVKFTVNSDGSIQDTEVIKSSGDIYLDKEAVRVIEAMPRWKPGREDGKAVRVKFVLPVNFRLQ